MNRFSEPVFTEVIPNAADLRPRSGSLYIGGTSVEERSEHLSAWEDACYDVTFARLERADRTAGTFRIGRRTRTVLLRSVTSVREFLELDDFTSYYLDVTGLPHHVWAPLLRGILNRRQPAFGVYAEPGDYRVSASPTEAAIFDLSERIEGIAPLPGFASFPGATEEDVVFVPLLGFEGPRFTFMLENVQPKRENIVPVVGVPGFRAEYPFYTYMGNRAKLWETRSWQNIRFAAANCPFALYNLLTELSAEQPGRRMVVAAIGTKPHAIGAVLFYLWHPARTELLYDHPVRKAARTSGTSRVCVYNFARLSLVEGKTGAEE